MKCESSAAPDLEVKCESSFGLSLIETVLSDPPFLADVKCESSAAPLQDPCSESPRDPVVAKCESSTAPLLADVKR